MCVHQYCFYSRRHREGPVRSHLRDGNDEDYWQTQEHHQLAGGLHTGRWVKGELRRRMGGGKHLEIMQYGRKSHFRINLLGALLFGFKRLSSVQLLWFHMARLIEPNFLIESHISVSKTVASPVKTDYVSYGHCQVRSMSLWSLLQRGIWESICVCAVHLGWSIATTPTRCPWRTCQSKTWSPAHTRWLVAWSTFHPRRLPSQMLFCSHSSQMASL